MKKGYITLLGFLVFLLGFLSILFSMVGLRFTFFEFISDLGRSAALGIHVILLFGGVIMMYLGRMPADEELED